MRTLSELQVTRSSGRCSSGGTTNLQPLPQEKAQKPANRYQEIANLGSGTIQATKPHVSFEGI